MGNQFAVYELTDLDHLLSRVQASVDRMPQLTGVVDAAIFSFDGSLKEGLISLQVSTSKASVEVTAIPSNQLIEIVKSLEILSGTQPFPGPTMAA